MPSGTIEDIEIGKATVIGHEPDGSVIATYKTEGETPPKRVWNMRSHNAESYGTNLLNATIGQRFGYPKSLYAVYDALRFFVANKPNALIVDFFAGSGTTLHAINLLNSEDDGHRRCIMVTNNEVSADEAESLTAQGYQPGNEKWEELGIARYVTWPRTVCSIKGCSISGIPLSGTYAVEMESYEPDDDVSYVSSTTGKPIKKAVYRKVKKQIYPQLANIICLSAMQQESLY